ncbi:MAG: nucleotidyltransferase domain-containing protein [Chloroflexota bacterium]
MAQIPVEIKDKIDKYLNDLRKNKIPIKEAILFGSYAKGTQKEWSDIDIALVSEIFKGNRIEDKDKIRHITISVSSEIEVIPFSPQDFNKDNPLAREIIDTGIRLL